jgi:hypothetical protein
MLLFTVLPVFFPLMLLVKFPNVQRQQTYAKKAVPCFSPRNSLFFRVINYLHVRLWQNQDHCPLKPFPPGPQKSAPPRVGFRTVQRTTSASPSRRSGPNDGAQVTKQPQAALILLFATALGAGPSRSTAPFEITTINQIYGTDRFAALKPLKKIRLLTTAYRNEIFSELRLGRSPGTGLEPATSGVTVAEKSLLRHSDGFPDMLLWTTKRLLNQLITFCLFPSHSLHYRGIGNRTPANGLAVAYRRMSQNGYRSH